MRLSYFLSIVLFIGAGNALAAAPTQEQQTESRTKAAAFNARNADAAPMTLSPMGGMAGYASAASQAPIDGAGIPVPAPQGYDYSGNLKSDVFGAKLFSGSFVQHGAIQFNPDYLIGNGDKLLIRLWGGFNFESLLTVDPQGNIFLPQVGPLKVLGVRNSELQHMIETAVRQVFRANVYSYASLANAQPVRIFVSGFVNRPGLYNGTSMDSLLHFLDQAGGIDTQRGSFLEVKVKRGQQIRSTVNLYDFLLRGEIPLLQLGDGDVIFVEPRRNTVKVSGLAKNSNRFEFQSDSLPLRELFRLAEPLADATNVRVIRNTGPVRNVNYYPIKDAADVSIGNGDEIELTADKRPGTITIRVEGEHQGPQEYVLPYGARIGALLKQVVPSERSDMQNLQLFRLSVRERQRALMQSSMNSLEAAVLTARSGTAEEATLRKEEAALVLQWIERAKNIEPRGQVVIAQSSNRDDLLLENGDLIRVPSKDGLILVSGEVLFPNAIAYDRDLTLADYLRRTGGLTQNTDGSRIIIAHRDGSFDDSSRNAALTAGDEVLVLPKVDVKSRQVWKEMTQIIYQIAISAKIAFGL
jgi:protein involved in polysaccharide export with SLBB domain